MSLLEGGYEMSVVDISFFHRDWRLRCAIFLNSIYKLVFAYNRTPSWYLHTSDISSVISPRIFMYVLKYVTAGKPLCSML